MVRYHNNEGHELLHRGVVVAVLVNATHQLRHHASTRPNLGIFRVRMWHQDKYIVIVVVLLCRKCPGQHGCPGTPDRWRPLTAPPGPASPGPAGSRPGPRWKIFCQFGDQKYFRHFVTLSAPLSQLVIICSIFLHFFFRFKSNSVQNIMS